MYKYSYSIIIPHRDSLSYLPKLFSSIPHNNDIEIILVDNSPSPIAVSSIRSISNGHNIKLLYSSPSRGAGGARNVGIENSNGKWLLFVDADDFLSENAFPTFEKYRGTDAEIVYFGMGGVYADTNEPSDRGSDYCRLVDGYLSGSIDEITLRLSYSSPCAKMVSHDLVNRHNLSYDEVIASNDIYFSMQSGYYAKKVLADSTIVYIATVNRGSLTRRRDLPVTMSRFKVALRYNKFLKEHKLGDYQLSVMVYMYQTLKFWYQAWPEMVRLLFIYRQNPFIGFKNWIKTIGKVIKSDRTEQKYIK